MVDETEESRIEPMQPPRLRVAVTRQIDAQ